MSRSKVLLSILSILSLGAAGAAFAKPELDSAGKCRDIKTKKFAKCGTAGTEPVPAK